MHERERKLVSFSESPSIMTNARENALKIRQLRYATFRIERDKERRRRKESRAPRKRSVRTRVSGHRNVRVKNSTILIRATSQIDRCVCDRFGKLAVNELVPSLEVVFSRGAYRIIENKNSQTKVYNIQDRLQTLCSNETSRTAFEDKFKTILNVEDRTVNTDL